MRAASSSAFYLKIKDNRQYITDVINKEYYEEDKINAVIKAIEIILNNYNDQLRKVIFITNMGDFQKFEDSQDRKALDYLTSRILLDVKYFLSDSMLNCSFIYYFIC